MCFAKSPQNSRPVNAVVLSVIGISMNRKNTPQEKKILDYVNQTKNAYGENDKSSRKAIRNRKAEVNRDYRREGKNILRGGDSDWESVDVELTEQQRIEWKKFSDEPLVEHMADYNRNELSGQLQKEAIKRVKKKSRDTNL